MILDKTTLDDLSFLKGENSIFSLINRCTTQAGTDVLRKIAQNPPPTYIQLKEQQNAVRFWIQHLDSWPSLVSNGTLVMVEQFYASSDVTNGTENRIILFLNALIQKAINRNTYSFVRFSISHLIDFLEGCSKLVELKDKLPPSLVLKELTTMTQTLAQPLCKSLLHTRKDASQKTLLQLSHRARREMKHTVYQLINAYARLDAFQSMARTTHELHWVLPELQPSDRLHYHAKNLHHPLLQKPIPYNIEFSKEKNFLFLTGANMSGKSTLIRSLGVAALLAHMGMGVPASSMEISFMEGIITNMQVEDNIFLGESYFYAEVKRMKLTAQKLNHNRYHLVLMDELFKGTNVHDAYECSRAVIEGLLHQGDNLMALSTHLNELSEDLEKVKNIWFRYCYTKITDNTQYEFTYLLKEGVSKDRIGYLVLKNEGVLDLLKNHNQSNT